MAGVVSRSHPQLLRRRLTVSAKITISLTEGSEYQFLPHGDPIYPNAERREPSEHKHLIERTECVGGCDLGAIWFAPAPESGWPEFHPSQGGQEPYCSYYEQLR
jgi:hypothetical protein